MSEEPKYYTPSIEEFHEGFEYEMKANFGDGTVKNQEQYDNAKWEKDVYTLRSFPYVDRTMNGNNPNNLPPALRVKYLDREDIESLGWNKSLNEDRLCYKDVTLRGEKKIARILIGKSNNHCLIYLSGLNQVYTEGETIFAGNIRNKSEFKRTTLQVLKKQ